MLAAGVTSNAGFATFVPAGAMARPARDATSSAARSSIGISAPLAIAGRSSRTAPRRSKGTPWGRPAPTARTSRSCWPHRRCARCGRHRRRRRRRARARTAAPAATSAISVCGMPSSRELPRGQARALQQGTRLVHPDVEPRVARVGRADDAERGAVAAGRERARVAMREHPRRLREQLRPVAPHRAGSVRPRRRECGARARPAPRSGRRADRRQRR